METKHSSIRQANQYSECPVFDASLCVLALIILSPMFVAIAAAVLIGSGRPIFFTQKRVGREGRLFRLLKFRTMRQQPGGAAITARGDPRITGVGRFLRKFKLDELPQFLNVIRGEMGIVGPRPEVPEFVDLSMPVWRAVLYARPGITDPASIAYRHEEQLIAAAPDPIRYYRETILPNKLALNLAYLEKRTLWSDCKVIVQTARCAMFPGEHDIRPAGILTQEDSE